MQEASITRARESTPQPVIELHAESGDWQVPREGRIDLNGPTRLRLIVSIKGARGWSLDLHRNGIVEDAHSSRRIIADEFCTVISAPVETSCAFRVSCCSGDGATARSALLVVRLASGGVASLSNSPEKSD